MYQQGRLLDLNAQSQDGFVDAANRYELDLQHDQRRAAERMGVRDWVKWEVVTIAATSGLGFTHHPVLAHQPRGAGLH